ncbi:MAG TPA: carbohydrate ABC transporter permease [Methylomirabilota bacterium]|jgi:multiple sugar transport system permease protein
MTRERRVAADVAVLAALALYATPLLWQLLTSLTPDATIAAGAWPRALSLEHYRVVVAQSPLPRALGNSAGVALIATALAAGLGVLAAYPLARLALPGRRLIMLAVVLSTAFPAIATVAPLYLVVRALGLRDTWAALVLADASFALPLMIWLLVGFLRELPPALEEAAFVDGAGRVAALRHVILPALAPGAAAAALLTFLFTWNEFLFAYTFTATEASRTAPVALALFPGVFEVPWGDIAAASILAALPPIVIVIVLQRHLVRGLLAGSLKD